MGVVLVPEKKPSRQDLNRSRRRGGFVGRQGELGLFRDNLARDPEDEAFQYLFHVHGQAGVGKTSLVRQWDCAARELGAVTVYLDDDVHSVVEAMEAISTQLRLQGTPLKGFEKLLAAYRQRRHEAETPLLGGADGTAGDGSAPAASPTATVMAQAGLAGLGLLPGMGPIAGALNPQQLAQSADRVRVALSARLRSHDDVQLVMSPVRVLTPVFLKDLTEVAERRPWVVLFFDVYERTAPVLDEWLQDILVGEDYPELPVNVLAVLSGQGRLDVRWWGDHLDLVAEAPLAVFTEDEARQLLAGRGVTDEGVVRVVLQLTGRLPVLVDTLALKGPQDPGEVADPSETAVGRFLRWVRDPDQQGAALVCALPLQLDEDVYRATVPEAAVDQYTWLRSLPFVTYQAGRCRYHDVVRDPMLRLQRTQSPTRWQQHHTLLADLHRQRRHASEDTLPPGELWNDTAWRDHRLNETYHHLCARSGAALSEALYDVVHACDHGKEDLRRWTQMIAQAGRDCADENLVRWGERLTAAAREDATGLVATMTQVLGASALGDSGRVLAYTLRGREHRNARRYEEALSDYASALSLDAGFARALYGQGEAYRLLGRYDEALISLTRAVELEPDDGSYLESRGMTYQVLGRYVDALADQNRALELDPGNAWLVSSRAGTYHAMGRYDDALADHDRAIGIDPGNAWFIDSRANTHRAMRRYDDALAGHIRALELTPDRAWSFSRRAATYQAMGRYEDALADHDRAIGIEPDNARFIVDRAETYRTAERHDDAVADYDRAVELAPGHSLPFAVRALALRALGRYDDALPDHDRALELDPDSAWMTANRGDIYRAMGCYDDAVADYTRAVELAPDRAWYRFDYGIALRLLYSPEHRDHLRRVTEMYCAGASADGPNAVNVKGNLTIVHCAAQEWDSAAEELERFLACAPTPRRIREAVDDLSDLQTSFPTDVIRIQPLRERLEDAAGQT
ncbi:tetratricopeptide repeat protein [Streptomyces guryensis]|uniref:Tetratricopeptide repeat protein n=1 Tax=Streptomyces guryensis TaxID=2886947 RepID=A0A9Q3VZ73_9ACTN|nr:tetratricopeptide repeat protein [Streptomyces guryensis]MCD9880867.1 tetratricopeptide repeat protein [Streptomyces guryensis]